MQSGDLAALLASAFDAARASGKRDWRRMTVAVLKNRVLQATERGFTEEQFGASSFVELVSQHPDLLRLDRTTKPPTVEWMGAQPSASLDATEAADLAAERVRADLWRSVLDYSSGREYEWDAAGGQARPVDKADPARRIPTVDKDVLAGWRAEFSARHRDAVDERDAKRLDAWATAGLGTQHLPRSLQGGWNAFLKTRVVARLHEWFQQGSFVEPNVLVAIEPTPATAKASDMRSFVHRCVDVMTADELRALMLPASVLLRVSGRE